MFFVALSYLQSSPSTQPFASAFICQSILFREHASPQANGITWPTTYGHHSALIWVHGILANIGAVGGRGIKSARDAEVMRTERYLPLVILEIPTQGILPLPGRWQAILNAVRWCVT